MEIGKDERRFIELAERFERGEIGHGAYYLAIVEDRSLSPFFHEWLAEDRERLKFWTELMRAMLARLDREAMH